MLHVASLAGCSMRFLGRGPTCHRAGRSWRGIKCGSNFLQKFSDRSWRDPRAAMMLKAAEEYIAWGRFDSQMRPMAGSSVLRIIVTWAADG